jgi:GDP-D-mannose dehydratase
MSKCNDNLTHCRICKYNNLQNVISLGEQYISSRFPDYGDFSTPKVNISLCICNNDNCKLLQLFETVKQDELYEYEYGYRSGINNSMKNHLKQYKEEIESYIKLEKGDYIVDIGSNDSTLLNYYSDDFKRIGIDPTGIQFKEYYGNVELISNYFSKEVFQDKYGDSKCKVISSISMFYDLPNPVLFAKDIYECLDIDGLWTCEQSYLLTMLKRNSIDTICHEHLEYYGLKQIKLIAELSGFKIIDIKFNDCNGGSFRIYFAKKESEKYKENIFLINKMLKEENEYGINNNEIYNNFMISCDMEINKLKDFIEIINKDNKKMFVYGASTKGNTLLQYAGLDEKSIQYAVERNPRKFNKMTSTGIKIISEDLMRELKPDFLLVLPYHFRDEIIEREKTYLENGGQLVFPLPNFEIYSLKPKMLITGCDGFIGSYIKDIFNEYSLYGMNRTKKNDEKNIIKIELDMNNQNKLENIINIIKPNSIIHLAGISNSQFAFNNPIDSLNNNGMLTAYLCDIIHKNNLNIKLFNASSSEIYKGHIDYMTHDNDLFKYNDHPYSIAKIMGHSMVDFYRKTYNLPFSNGIIFSTESSKKSQNFLFSKVINHIKHWNDKKEPLVLGSINSFRNIIHPIDVSNAIKTIINQQKGDNYLICNNESYHIYDLVIEIYKKSNIDLYEKYNILYCSNLHIPVIKFELNPAIENDVINIKGNPTNLLNLGWTPQFSKNDILNEYLTSISNCDL